MRSEVKPQLRSYLRAQQALFEMGSHETTGLRKDGATFPMEFNVGWLGPQRLVIGVGEIELAEELGRARFCLTAANFSDLL